MPIRPVFAVMATVGVAIGAAACGGNSGDRGDGGTKVKAGIAALTGAQPGQGRKGGHLTALAANDIDRADPGQTYSAFGYMVHYAVNRTLYSYAAGDNAK